MIYSGPFIGVLLATRPEHGEKSLTRVAAFLNAEIEKGN